MKQKVVAHTFTRDEKLSNDKHQQNIAATKITERKFVLLDQSRRLSFFGGVFKEWNDNQDFRVML